MVNGVDTTEVRLLDRQDTRSPLRILSAVLLTYCLLARAFAGDVPIDQIPAPVLDTIKRESATGTVKSAEVYDWGNTKIYRVEVDVNGVPDLELQIAQDGKLVRSDSLRPEDEETGQDAKDEALAQPVERQTRFGTDFAIGQIGSLVIRPIFSQVAFGGLTL
jgi:hypothetical protein